MKTKLKSILTAGALFMMMPREIHAAFDEEKAKALIMDDFLIPMKNVVFIVLPIVMIIATAVTYIKWAASDESERAQKPFSRSFLKTIQYGVLVWSISAILTIFGIN